MLVRRSLTVIQIFKRTTSKGDVAQMVERSLSMREVRGSIPRISISIDIFLERAFSILGLVVFVCVHAVCC